MGAALQEELDRLSFRAAVAKLRCAYEQDDAGHVVTAYDDARRRSCLFRLLTGLLEPIYPVRGFLRSAADLFDPAISEDGLHGGCRRILDTLPLDWECQTSAADAAVLRFASVIFYGNHPSLLTPFLAAACVDREDLRFCSTSYVRRLIPSFSGYSYPLEVPLTRSWTEWKRGGARRVLAYRLISLLHAVPSPDEAKRVNLEALGRAADHLRCGGSIMIIPGGGGKRDRTWFSGIGILATDLIGNPGAEPVYVVATREENCSNRRMYATLMRGPIALVRRRLMSRRPVRMRFARPIPLREVVGENPTVAGAVDALRRHYEAAFVKS